ncbi:MULTISPECIES: RNase A-like domain-containing protein [unclassified Enterococcus]|uniref:RNase A-like domain-containing protein n=1 Tax=unclassified Enterococcus TaxID=2608891 RepID=UPI003D2A56BB
MKKLYLLVLLTLSLTPYFVLPTAVVAEAHIVQSELAEETNLPPVELEPAIPQMTAIPINAFSGLSLSAFATAAGGGTLSAGLLSGAAASIIGPAILGIGLGYTFYQLGQALGSTTADLAKTNHNLSHYFDASADAQQELNQFIRSGVDSTTNTYDFSESLQSYYARSNLGHTIMREFLTGTSHHGSYDFDKTNAPGLRKSLTYGIRWNIEPQHSVIVRDTSMNESPIHESMFFVLDRFSLRETYRGSSQTLLMVSGELFHTDPFVMGYLREIVLDIPMDYFLERLTTPEEFLTFIRENTPYEFGSISVPSRERARDTAVNMARAYTARHREAAANLTQLIASEDPMQFDPSGLVARLNGRPVTATTSGNFIYADNRTPVPADLWHSIEFIYDAEAIPYDDAITIDGKRGVFDPATGHIIDVNGNILMAYTLGAAWTIINHNLYTSTVSKWEEDDSKWYTPLDFIYDELFTRGHTIRDHVGKDKKFLEARLDDKDKPVKEATTFYEPITPLIMINAAIFSAKPYLNGTITGIPGVDSITSPLGTSKVGKNNKIVFTSKEGLLSGIPTGWGIERVDGVNKIHSEIPDTLVTIQRKSKQVRKNRYYFILTAYPEIRTNSEH